MLQGINARLRSGSARTQHCRAPTHLSGQYRSRRWPECQVPLDFGTPQFKRLRQAKGLAEIFPVLVQGEIAGRRDGADMAVRIAEMEDFRIDRILNTGD